MKVSCLMIHQDTASLAQTHLLPGQELRLKSACSTFALMLNKVNKGPAPPSPERPDVAQCQGWGVSLQEPRSSASQTPSSIISRSLQEGTLGPSPVLAQLATNNGALLTAHMQSIMHVGSRRVALSRCPHPNTWHLIYEPDRVKSLCGCD